MQTKKRKKIIITGGAGFLGSHLCQSLLEEGHFVTCVDNLTTGQKKNIRNLQRSKRFNFLKCDILKLGNLKVDEIYNFACPASPVSYQSNPIQTLKTNILGTLNLLEIARKNNSKIFQASTSEVYGDPIKHPQKESDWGNVNPVGIRSCYDEGKRAAETLMFDYFRTYKLKIKIVRIFNTYGPKMLQNDGRVISNFIVQCLKNRPITIYGKGKQTRSFCYVDDMIKAFKITMNTTDGITGPINLGNPKEYKILEIANKIKKLTNSKSKITYKDLPDDDPKRRRPNITKAKRLLNWTPHTNLETGLARTIEYFKKEI